MATAIFIVIMTVTLTLLSGSSKEREDLRTNLEANEKVLRAFERIGHEVLEASMVEWPPVLDPAIVPIPFLHRSPVESTGRLVLITERPVVSRKQNGIESTQQKVVFFLDRPVKLGVAPGGEEVRTFTLFLGSKASLQAETPTTGPPGSQAGLSERATLLRTPVAIVDGITELIFWRAAAFGPADNRGGAGPAVVHVLLRSAAVRKRPEKKLGLGYQAEFRSCFAIRGKDILARRERREVPP